MSKVPEAEIDELYQLPLAGFTAARNTLAKTLKGAEAQRIKQLAKPTLVPWTVNQLYWHARSIYDRVAAAGRALRDAQIAALKRQGADVRQATENHRKAIAAAVREGLALAAKEGARPPADQLARMLEAMSLARASTAAPGRLTELVLPSGFEALAGITPSGAKDAPTPSRSDDDTAAAPTGPRLVTSAPVPRRPDPVEARRRAADERRRVADERKREKERAAARARAEAAVSAAERELTDARKALERAERTVADARQAVQDADRKLATARGERVLSSPHV